MQPSVKMLSKNLALTGLFAASAVAQNVVYVTEIVFANNRVCSAPVYVLSEDAQPVSTYTLSLDLPSTTGTEFIFTTPVIPTSQAGATQISTIATNGTQIQTSQAATTQLLTSLAAPTQTSIGQVGATQVSPSSVTLPSCTQNACYSAVASPTDDSPMADCSANFVATITPPPVVSTETVTGPTQTVTRVISSDTTVEELRTATNVQTIISVDADLVTVSFFTSSVTERQVTASVFPAIPTNTDALGRRQVVAVPSYASTCGSFSEYTSACSCLGVTQSTTSLTPSTTTSTLTIYPTVTSFINVGNTAIQTILTTISATDVVLSTVTSTITDLAVLTQVVAPPASAPTTVLVLPPDNLACGNAYVPNGNCGCSYEVICGMSSNAGETSGPYYVASPAECGQLCDDYNDCAAANFESSTGNCTLLSNTLTSPVVDMGFYMIVYDGEYACDPADPGVCTSADIFPE